MSIAYDQSVIGSNKQDGQRLSNSKTTHVGSLIFGTSYKLGENTSLGISLGGGVTEAAPDQAVLNDREEAGLEIPGIERVSGAFLNQRQHGAQRLPGRQLRNALGVLHDVQGIGGFQDAVDVDEFFDAQRKFQSIPGNQTAARVADFPFVGDFPVPKIIGAPREGGAGRDQRDSDRQGDACDREPAGLHRPALPGASRVMLARSLGGIAVPLGAFSLIRHSPPWLTRAAAQF